MLTEWKDSRSKPRIQKRVYPWKLNRMPRDKEEQNQMADELISWALIPSSVLLEEFPLSKNISPYRFFKFAKEESNEYFTDAFDFARSCCAVRMQKGEHELDIGLLHKIFPLYHRQYDEYLIEKENRAIEAKKIVTGNEDVQFVVKMQNVTTDLKPCSVINIEKKTDK